MKTTNFFLLLLSISISSFGQISKENLFGTSVKNVLEMISNKDSVLMLKLIDENNGVFTLYNDGNKVTYVREAKLNFEYADRPGIIYNEKIDFSPIRYQTYPVYDCKFMKWNKVGIYCDTTYAVNKISIAFDSLTEGLEQKGFDKFRTYVTGMEKESRRVVAIDSKNNSIEFYLIYNNSKWTLLAVDKTKNDCKPG